MPLTGPEALRSLDEAVRDIRTEENDIAKRLARSGERVAKLRDSEMEFLRQLAALRMSPDVRDDLQGRLSRAEEDAHELLARHAADLEATESDLKALDAKIAGKAKARTGLLEELDAAQSELRGLSAKIAKAVAKDPAYEAKRNEAEELGRIADESLHKTELAETDREQKGRPYREDPLFMYLWESGYGTKNYTANNLIKWLDSLVARMVRYHDARPNFAMLNEIPLRLREHADYQAERARQAEAELDALEEAAIDAAGGKPLRNALNAAQAKIESLDSEMMALEDERDELARAYRHLVEGRDPAFSDAHAGVAEALSRQDIATLVADARQTRTSEDDALVEKVDDIRVRIEEENEDTAEAKARLKVLATRRQELEDIEWEFKKSRYDDPRSTFRDDGLAGDMLGEFLRGAITAAVYWDQWQKSQSWRPGTTDWGGGFGLPRSGRAPRARRGSINIPTGNPWGGSSGGFSRPRTGSRGSRKSGGFKTGGGF